MAIYILIQFFPDFFVFLIQDADYWCEFLVHASFQLPFQRRKSILHIFNELLYVLGSALNTLCMLLGLFPLYFEADRFDFAFWVCKHHHQDHILVKLEHLPFETSLVYDLFVNMLFKFINGHKWWLQHFIRYHQACLPPLFVIEMDWNLRLSGEVKAECAIASCII